MRSILAAIGRALKGILRGGTSIFSWTWDHAVAPVFSATNHVLDGIDHVAGAAIKGTLGAAASILTAPFRAAPAPQQGADGTADNAARNEVAKLEATKAAKPTLDQISEIRRVALRLFRDQSTDQARLSPEVKTALEGVSKKNLKALAESPASTVAAFVGSVVKVSASEVSKRTTSDAEDAMVIRIADRIAARDAARMDPATIAHINAVRASKGMERFTG
jgi:hypothetical protein